jgi:beta-carotene hydroxylase
MTRQSSSNDAALSPPSLNDLGLDLLSVSQVRRSLTIGLPFVLTAAYFLFAAAGWWSAAVLAVMALCFVTYGSSSHDLVHHTLHLPRQWNDSWLSVIELLSLRSGTAYRLSHLHHHRHLLDGDDIEGAAAHGSLWRAFASGPTMQLRLWRWAWRAHPEARIRLAIEASGVVLLTAAAIAATPYTVAPLIYAALVVAGSWVFPVVTVYIPHDARGTTPLSKTVLFRGCLARLVAFDHLYHLEHHLYPAVPHHHWRSLAVRLDPYFRSAGVTPYARKAAHEDA